MRVLLIQYYYLSYVQKSINIMMIDQPKIYDYNYTYSMNKSTNNGLS